MPASAFHSTHLHLGFGFQLGEQLLGNIRKLARPRCGHNNRGKIRQLQNANACARLGAWDRHGQTDSITAGDVTLVWGKRSSASVLACMWKPRKLLEILPSFIQLVSTHKSYLLRFVSFVCFVG
jgi:hypothetical protein